MNYTLGADKRLKSQKSIDRLFVEGKRLHKFPITAVYYREESETSTYQIAVSVPKRLFKKAVDRNLLKRRLREAFRLNQDKLNLNSKLEVMFIYMAREKLDYKKIERSMVVLLGLLNSSSTVHTENK